MKTISETKLNKVLEFIKEFQVKEGKSPSFRQIAKAVNFPSLSTAQKYVKILHNRNLIEQSNSGRIVTPIRLQVGKTIVAPLVGSVACGSPILAEQNIEASYQLPTSIFGSGEMMLLHAKGDSMIGVGIQDWDLLVAKITNKAEDGDIVIALIEDSATVKRFRKTKEAVILHPENPKYNDIVCSDVKIQGIVKQVIHNL